MKDCIPSREDYNVRHFQAFTELSTLGAWKPRDLSKWKLSVPIEGLSNKATSELLTRDRLKEMSRDKAVEDRDFMWAVLCWGKMHEANARRLIRSDPSPLFPVIRSIRDGTRTRKEAFAAFSDTIAAKSLKGLQPAFFTKIIFFALPGHDGYIMDQWTSRATNLLVQVPFIKTSNGYVRKSNTAEIFERYCQVVEELAELRSTVEKSITPEAMEMHLFGTGGYKACAWRRYLRKHSPKNVS